MPRANRQRGLDPNGSSATPVVPKYLSDRFRRIAHDCQAVDARLARRGTAASALWLAGGLAALGAGLFLAWHHPLWPMTASIAFALWTVVAARYRGLWLLVVPAALPALNLSPWTGWLAWDEFDLLLLGSLAGGFARHLRERADSREPGSGPRAPDAARAGAFLALAFAAVGLASLVRGLIDAGPWSLHWFDGYADAANSVRVAKSLVYVAALWPLLQLELSRSPARALRRFALGMQLGLTFVGLAVLWERAAYPGVLDFSTRYRTTATFWEMHVGGAAIDAYLALATPFAAWALWSARSQLGWTAAALLALLTAHAGLTTFSRGAYAGIAVPLVLLGGLWWLRRLRIDPRSAWMAAAWSIALASGAAALLVAAFLVTGYAGTGLALLLLLILILASVWRARSLPWRRAAGMALTIALMTETIAVIGGGSFIRSRVDATQSDLAARLAHWRHGIELLRSPAEWLVGIGTGRLPPRYSHQVASGEFSGAVSLRTTESGRQVARLAGPNTEADLAGLFALTQRVRLLPNPAYQVSLQVRGAQPTDVAVNVCEQHLLYPRQCQEKIFHLSPVDGNWQWLTSTLEGPNLTTGSWYVPRHAVFSVTVADAGRHVDIAYASLRAWKGTELLENRDFASGLVHWFPIAQGHFLPWHIDNLYLELLIERGVLGLATFFLLLACAFRNLHVSRLQGVDIAPFFGASLFGALLVGTVSSVIDMPRVAFLVLLLLTVSLQPGLRNHRCALPMR